MSVTESLTKLKVRKPLFILSYIYAWPPMHCLIYRMERKKV